jgi:myo-inositol-1(or 4)-monophosphatase
MGLREMDWSQFFQETVDAIRRATVPLLGSTDAGVILGHGAGGDRTRYIDAVAEEVVIAAIRAAGLSCILVSEESGAMAFGDDPTDYVVLDGIDGTTNALRNIPFTAVSIAHAEGSRLSDVDVGFVVDLARGIAFTARKGGGAYMDDRPVRPSAEPNLRKALLSVELTFPRPQRRRIARLFPLLSEAGKLRHLGSTALELCYVAVGSLDAFVDARSLTRAVDIAAATLILREAGGLVVDLHGAPLDMKLGASERAAFVAAANPRLCGEILRHLP